MADPIQDWLASSLGSMNASTGPTPTIPHQLGRVGLGLANILYGQGRDTLEATKLPGQVMMGQAAPSPENAARFGMSVAGLGSMGVAPAGSLGMFVGRRSATANAPKMFEAIEKHNLGVDPQTIWKETGHFLDKDGNWKSEIPDYGADIKLGPHLTMESLFPGLSEPEPWFRAPAQPTPLKDILHHPDLFQAYPQLADTNVISVPFGAPPNLKGGINQQGDIMLRGGMADDNLSTILHELQHKIQGIEGFASGGSASEFLPPQYRSNGTVPLDTAIAAAAARERAYTKYLNLAGEVEARNVQERLSQSDYSSHPHDTYQYPQGDQIVRFGFEPVEHDPFQAQHSLEPIDHNPFASILEPIDHDPFGAQP